MELIQLWKWPRHALRWVKQEKQVQSRSWILTINGYRNKGSWNGGRNNLFLLLYLYTQWKLFKRKKIQLQCDPFLIASFNLIMKMSKILRPLFCLKNIDQASPCNFLKNLIIYFITYPGSWRHSLPCNQSCSCTSTFQDCYYKLPTNYRDATCIHLYLQKKQRRLLVLKNHLKVWLIMLANKSNSK